MESHPSAKLKKRRDANLGSVYTDVSLVLVGALFSPGFRLRCEPGSRFGWGHKQLLGMF